LLFGGAGIVWVLICWRVLRIRKQIIHALKQDHREFYDRITEPIRSARLLDRIFATSEVFDAQCEADAAISGKESPRDARLDALRGQYRRWGGCLIGLTFLYIVGIFLVAWLAWRLNSTSIVSALALTPHERV